MRAALGPSVVHSLSVGHLGRDERGATLTELLVALTLSSLLVGLITTAVHQFFLVTRFGHDQLLLRRDLESAALWLGRDASEANTFIPGAGSVYGTLAWADASTQFRYSYDAVQTALVREVILNDVVQSNQVLSRRIAAQADVAFAVNGGLLSVSMTTTLGGRSESMALQLAMRAR